MTVKELIEKLQGLDQNKQVYLSDNDLDEDTYFYQALDVREINVGEDGDIPIVSILYRN
jgi:hypothetical protein